MPTIGILLRLVATQPTRNRVLVIRHVQLQTISDARRSDDGQLSRSSGSLVKQTKLFLRLRFDSNKSVTETAKAYSKTVTTLAWQLKPKTMMGMANSALNSKMNQWMSSHGAPLALMICNIHASCQTCHPSRTPADILANIQSQRIGRSVSHSAACHAYKLSYLQPSMYDPLVPGCYSCATKVCSADHITCHACKLPRMPDVVCWQSTLKHKYYFSTPYV